MRRTSSWRTHTGAGLRTSSTRYQPRPLGGVIAGAGSDRRGHRAPAEAPDALARRCGPRGRARAPPPRSPAAGSGWESGVAARAPGRRRTRPARPRRTANHPGPPPWSLTTAVVGAAWGVAAAFGAGCVVRELRLFLCVEEGRCARRSMRARRVCGPTMPSSGSPRSDCSNRTAAVVSGAEAPVGSRPAEAVAAAAQHALHVADRGARLAAHPGALGEHRRLLRGGAGGRGCRRGHQDRDRDQRHQHRRGSSPVAQGDQLRSHCCSLRNVSSGRRADARHGVVQRTGRRRRATRRVREETPKGLARPFLEGDERRRPPAGGRQAKGVKSLRHAAAQRAHGHGGRAARPGAPSGTCAAAARATRRAARETRGAAAVTGRATTRGGRQRRRGGGRVVANAARTGEALMPAGVADVVGRVGAARCSRRSGSGRGRDGRRRARGAARRGRHDGLLARGGGDDGGAGASPAA